VLSENRVVSGGGVPEKEERWENISKQRMSNNSGKDFSDI
jgi:hypothetical protein